MTDESLTDDLMYLASQGKLEKTGLKDHLEFCKRCGLNDFWCAAPWSWATRPYELTIATVTTEGYELPEDFRGIRSVRQKTSTYGGPIEFYSTEEFDREWPYPASFTADTPIACTVYYDRKAAVWYIKFNRNPESGTIIYIDMYTSVGAVDAIPQGYEGGLLSSIEKYLYKPGSPERFAAQEHFQRELARLQAVDSPFRGHLTQILQPPTEARGDSWLSRNFG